MTVDEILSKLDTTFQQEGVHFESLGSEGHRLLVRAKRSGPGTPVAFLVKALEGTLRRYHEQLREVELVEYDPGEGHTPPPETPSQEFDKVFKHRGHSSKLNLPQVPGLDLRGCDRAQAIIALEQAHKMWLRQELDRFKIRGLSEDAVARAVQKWVTFYAACEHTELEADQDTMRVVLKDARSREFPDEDTLWFPARLMLIES